MAGEPTGELKGQIPSNDPESVPLEIQKGYFLLMDAIRASQAGNGDFFVAMGRKAEGMAYIKADTQAIMLKEGRRNPESDQVDYVVFTRLGTKIVTTPEGYVEQKASIEPSSGAYVHTGKNFSGIIDPGVALNVSGKYFPMRDVVSEADRAFVEEALFNSIIESKKRLLDREIRSARRIAREQKAASPKNAGEKATIDAMSAFVTETAHDGLVLRSPRPH